MADLSCAIDSTADNTLQIGPNGKFYVPPANTDDQAISLAGNILTLEDGGTVDLSPFLDDTDTDDQTITQFTLSPAGILTLEIQDGNTVNVDLSSLTTVDTDDQTLALAGTLLSIADGNSVDLSIFSDTDVSAASASLAGSVLTVGVTEDGVTVSDTEDLQPLLNLQQKQVTNAGASLPITFPADAGAQQLGNATNVDAMLESDGIVPVVDASGNRSWQLRRVHARLSGPSLVVSSGTTAHMPLSSVLDASTHITTATGATPVQTIQSGGIYIANIITQIAPGGANFVTDAPVMSCQLYSNAVLIRQARANFRRNTRGANAKLHEFSRGIGFEIVSILHNR